MDNSENYTSQTSVVNRFFRTESNETRLIWIFIIIPIYLIFTLVLSRLIFVLFQTQFYIMEGYSQILALEQAQTQMMSLESQVVLCAIDSLFMLLLVFLLVTKIEKRNFQWSALGLTLKTTSIFYLLIGVFLGFLFMFITIGAGLIQGTIRFQPLELEEILTSENVKFLILFFVWAMFNGFWQELVFRGYLQTRVVGRYGVPVGILASTIYFVLIHFIDRQLTLLWILGMTLLFILISLLFHHTRSLFLVGAMHGMINYFDRVTELLGLEWNSPVSVYRMQGIVILGVALGIYLLISFIVTKTKTRSENRTNLIT